VIVTSKVMLPTAVVQPSGCGVLMNDGPVAMFACWKVALVIVPVSCPLMEESVTVPPVAM
jgi:hypothetical protein